MNSVYVCISVCDYSVCVCGCICVLVFASFEDETRINIYYDYPGV